MYIDVFRMPWVRAGTINAVAAAADGALGVTERELSIIKNLTNVVIIPYLAPIVTAIEIRFLLTTNGANVNVDLWAGRKDSNQKADLTRIATLDIECGGQISKDAVHYYADEISLTNESWLKDIATIQSADGSDLMARLVLYLCGYDVFVAHGHTTFPEDCIVEFAAFA